VVGQGIRIGVDLGGTKIEILALAPDGRALVRRRAPSPGSYVDTVRAVSAMVRAAETELNTHCTVGVGIPGAISPATGLVKNANSTWLIGHAFDQDLGAALERPVRVANDANCFALSEAVDGAGKGARTVFGAIVGTGTGGGIAVDASVLTGPNAIAGEWGHNPLPWPDASEYPGPECYCGRRGCIETWCSGPGLARDLLSVSGRRLTAEEIAAAATDGDLAADAALARYERRLGKALASLVNVLDPDVIVLGGGLSNLDRLYTSLPPLIAAYAFSDAITTPVRKNVWGDSGGVRGAAWLWGPGET
jgi:fructokinase